jgi:YYY domain-containing protein
MMQSSKKTSQFIKSWWIEFLLVVILLAGGAFRLVGIHWDETFHLHPDERFLTMVETGISPVGSPGEYFNTDTSSLNPQNRGYGFFVYGTFPIFLVRYLAEWTGQTGYDQVTILGRAYSAAVDLLTVLLCFMIAWRLFRSKAIALLSAAFYAFAVLPIQLSHYWTVDTSTNFFGMLTFFIAVLIQTTPQTSLAEIDPSEKWFWIKCGWKHFTTYALFGIALGMATASKVNAGLLAILLPGAAIIFFSNLDASHKDQYKWLILRNVILAGAISLLTFRILQPYAFSAPGFLTQSPLAALQGGPSGLLRYIGWEPNPKWVGNLRELSALSAGDSTFPPGIQWARRPLSFAWQNLTIWGLGLPLGILAWAGFLWMGIRILKGTWKPYLLLWGWTLVYFLWQSINFTRSMRYQMLVYPTLAIIAAWTIFSIWQAGTQKEVDEKRTAGKWLKGLSIFVGATVLVSTILWAYSFSRIYTRPITRLAASEWIYQNVPGPVDINIENNGTITNQPLAYPLGTEVTLEKPVRMVVTNKDSGNWIGVDFSHIVDPSGNSSEKTLLVTATDLSADIPVVASGSIRNAFAGSDDPRGNAYKVLFDQTIILEPGHEYSIEFRVLDPGVTLNLAGPTAIRFSWEGETASQALPEPSRLLQPGEEYTLAFNPRISGNLTGLTLGRIVDWESVKNPKKLELLIESSNPDGSFQGVGRGSLSADFLAKNNPRGEPATIVLDQPVKVEKGQPYRLTLTFAEGEGALGITGSRQINESSWDDPLPYPMDGYSPFDYNNGIFRTDLNLELYWDDNAEKLQRITNALDQGDIIFISSNRQWGSLTRIPERYPLVSAYYRNLIGCPGEKTIYQCYAEAKPGDYQGRLGYELVQTFDSNPRLGPLQFNTQYAEEAFTVYDHPKVLIFRKTNQYDPAKVLEILGQVDLSKVIDLTPKTASKYKGNLTLPPEMLAVQQAGGTWSDYFSYENPLNKYPILGLVVWYLTLTILGWIVYPTVRIAFGGLRDKGYPVAKLAGLLLLAFLVWMAGSNGLAFSRLTILGALILILGGNLFLFFRDKQSIVQELKDHWHQFLIIELFGLLFFIAFVLVRLGNPDLWHPAKGGEKPMDFSYFNAILKSTTFPPYDPWFAGGYINYYYYGFVLVGMLVKLLGIVPAIAYNLILPTLFSLVALGAYCIGSNLSTGLRKREGDESPEFSWLGFLGNKAFLGGAAAAIFMLVMGNLGTIRMIWQGLQKIGSSGIPIDSGNFLQKWLWTFEGFGGIFSGIKLPIGPGDWYWIPSRVYPGEPITEFPMFTFLYADLHAHMIALPLTLLAIAWAVAVIQGRWKWVDHAGKFSWLNFALVLGFGGLAVGALRPTNTWDLPTYLVLACLAVIYSGVKYAPIPAGYFQGLSENSKRWLVAIGSAILLAGAAFILYEPFGKWFGQAYNNIEVWHGDRSPIWSYLTHWGVFLFIIASWLIHETLDWMASTPASALEKLKPIRWWIYIGLLLITAAIVVLMIDKIQIAWLVALLALTALVLLFRPGQDDLKRVVLFMIGSGFALTIAVELIVIKGDIGRMNTVFKFYLQSWTLFSLSAAAALMWLWDAIPGVWPDRLRRVWEVVLIILIGGALLFPLTAGMDKITDRMSPVAPHTLDGMEYMKTARYSDFDKDMDLSQDYRAIRWMQDNIKGSPVIVEANVPEYRWGTRFTIYTGLPGVVGWNWHQRQQRAVVNSDWVQQRVDQVGQFFSTLDEREVRDFLNRYNVRFIIVGQLERAEYSAEGIAKFENLNGKLWDEVYRDGETVIYRVREGL